MPLDPSDISDQFILGATFGPAPSVDLSPTPEISAAMDAAGLSAQKGNQEVVSKFTENYRQQLNAAGNPELGFNPAVALTPDIDPGARGTKEQQAAYRDARLYRNAIPDGAVLDYMAYDTAGSAGDQAGMQRALDNQNPVSEAFRAAQQDPRTIDAITKVQKEQRAQEEAAALAAQQNAEIAAKELAAENKKVPFIMSPDVTANERARASQLNEASIKAQSDALETQAALDETRESLEADAQKIRSKTDQRIIEINAEARKQQERRMANMQRYQEEREKLAAENLDPNEYWSSAPMASKAMALIAGALFGFTGKGMEWLNHMQSVARDDYNARLANKNARLANADKKLLLEKDMSEQDKELFRQDVDNETAKLNSRLGWFKVQFDKIARDSTNAQVKAAAAEKAAMIGERILTNAQQHQARVDAQTEAQRRNQEANAQREARLQVAKLKQKFAKQALLPADIRKTYSDLIKAAGGIKFLTSEWRSGKFGESNAALQTTLSAAPLIGDKLPTNTNIWKAKASEIALGTAKPLLGVLSNQDVKLMYGTLLESPAETDEKNAAVADARLKSALNKYNAFLETARATGIDTEAFDTPEEFAARMQP